MSADFESLDFSGADVSTTAYDDSMGWNSYEYGTPESAGGSWDNDVSGWLDSLRTGAAGAFGAAKDVLQFQIMKDQLDAQRDARSLARDRQALDAHLADNKLSLERARADADQRRLFNQATSSPGAGAGLSTGAILALAALGFFLLRGKA